MGSNPKENGGTPSASSIPIIDFAGWNSSSLGQKRSTAAQLIKACQSIGFVYIINHQIPRARVTEAFSWSKKLFDLSSEEKKLAPHPEGAAVHRGYSWPGLEKVSNLMGDEEDAHLAKEVRQVADVKVNFSTPFHFFLPSFFPKLPSTSTYQCLGKLKQHPIIHSPLRRATKSEVKPTRSSPTSGFQSTSCRASERS